MSMKLYKLVKLTKIPIGIDTNNLFDKKYNKITYNTVKKIIK